MKDVVLADDNLAPLTEAISFLSVPPETFAEWLASWRRDLHGDATVTRHEGGFFENFRRLEPLVSGAVPRELVVGTAHPSWSAIFTSGVHGADTVGTIRVLAGMHEGVTGISVVSVPDRRATGDVGDRYGSRQFHVIVSPDLTPFRRSVSVARDGGSRWTMDTYGDVQPFERPEYYERRRVADRLPGELLVEYAAHFGLRPFDSDFYPGPSYLVRSPVDHHVGRFSMTLEEARIANELD